MNDAPSLLVSPRAALAAISQVGDLSMGQPLGHSMRVARLARQLAEAGTGQGGHLAVAEHVALLRWSGCTANAEGFSHLLGNDVDGRRAMLDQTLGLDAMQAVHKASSLAVVHCEVSEQVASTLGLGADVEGALYRVFETYDGSGRPAGLTRGQIPEVVYQVVLAGDLEILSRTHGLDSAIDWIGAQCNRRYPAALAELLMHNAADWLAQLESTAQPSGAESTEASVPLSLVGDVIDLKLPWLAGHSRQVAHIAIEAARLMGISEAKLTEIGKAALIHGLGRAAVSNHIWNSPGPLPYGAAERLHLVPYWTQKACKPIAELAGCGEIAAHAYERLDGSGYYRGLSGDALSAEHRILATANAWIALQNDRPWRPAHSRDDAQKILRQEASRGAFDNQVCETVIAAANGQQRVAQPRSSLLTTRECDVLSEISRGASNKEVARTLSISPSTVRTHMESIFRKLECSTRAAATLKGLTLGLIS
ncbi:HD domain-containing phosphohydrolase [Pseudomonas sp. sia0905]|uniref:HD domain-containing phosphohydrolase n=1 Tax=Pseudomonas sp. sia0905 TaxID=2854783 RepID=UPI001C439AFE|nr:HD domain-containing phosphohydrolase [Pseudomonas sp. sia0905]MBV7562718.1 LuxR C-terminal-related transcriptional regulator [Pseudomonas sp. sia0905]